MSSEITVGLTIKDAPEQMGQALGVSIVYGEGHAGIEAYGFHPSQQGAKALAEMLHDLASAVESEVEMSASDGRTVKATHTVRANPKATGPTQDTPKRAFNPQPR